jgi:hypothetical protein
LAQIGTGKGKTAKYSPSPQGAIVEWCILTRDSIMTAVKPTPKAAPLSLQDLARPDDAKTSGQIQHPKPQRQHDRPNPPPFGTRRSMGKR